MILSAQGCRRGLEEALQLLRHALVLSLWASHNYQDLCRLWGTHNTYKRLVLSVSQRLRSLPYTWASSDILPANTCFRMETVRICQVLGSSSPTQRQSPNSNLFEVGEQSCKRASRPVPTVTCLYKVLGMSTEG